MKENKLIELSMGFSVDIINLVKHLKSSHEFIISNQIGRSGTNLGTLANDAAHFSEKIGAITPYFIYVDFNIER